MIKRMVIMIIGLVVVFGGVFGWHAFVSSMIAKSMASRRPPPAPGKLGVGILVNSRGGRNDEARGEVSGPGLGPPPRSPPH